MVDQFRLELHQCLDDALKGGSHIGEIGNTASDDQYLVLFCFYEILLFKKAR